MTRPITTHEPTTERSVTVTLTVDQAMWARQALKRERGEIHQAQEAARSLRVREALAEDWNTLHAAINAIEAALTAGAQP